MNFLRKQLGPRKAKRGTSASTPMPTATAAERISAVEVRQKLISPDSDALLVCAYESHKKCEKLRLEGAITLTELKSKESELSTGQELIFYCA